MTIRKNSHFGILRPIRAFCGSEKGSVIPLVGLAFFVIMGAIGMAIDIGRAQLVESRLMNSIDAAGLAAGAKLNTASVQNEVEKFVHANYPAGYADSVVSSIATAVTDGGNTITVSATAVMQTAFMQLFGVDEVTVSATSEITRAIGGLELSLVLDNTGSMGNNNKLEDLQDASHELLNIVFGSETTANRLFVGVVPFSQSVNIGTGRAAWLNAAPPAGWGGCVRARTGPDPIDRDTSDDPPTTELFARYTSSSGCPAPLTPMTNVKATLDDAIDDMVANGLTHVNYGAVWGWRMLSPKWRAAWGINIGGQELPLDYDAPSMKKAAVIMTDGENTMRDNRYTAYGELDEGNLNGATSENNAVNELNDRLLMVCNNMKNAGITVYTVAFGNPGAAIEAMMEQCASQSDFYFDPSSGADLSLAFQVIGDSLANLRVSK